MCYVANILFFLVLSSQPPQKSYRLELAQNQYLGGCSFEFLAECREWWKGGRVEVTVLWARSRVLQVLQVTSKVHTRPPEVVA